MNKIVILDDEVDVVDMLRTFLAEKNFKVYCFYSAEEFFNSNESFERCIYIIDAGLPGIQGTDVIKTIRFRDQLSPIFMISGSNSQSKINAGLNSGADDYIVKPFDIDSLLTKIENAQRKSSLINNRLNNADFKKFPESQSIMRNGKVIKFTMCEYNIVDSILLELESKKSRKNIIADSVNGNITERTIDVHIHAIRKKLDHIGMKVVSIRGYGYRITFN